MATRLNTDTCLDTCVDASCGDAYVQAGVEDCDDANANDRDSCIGCLDADCGDGYRWDEDGGTEECDGRNLDLEDGCDDGCLAEHGYVCDDTGCYSDCGDGLVASDEACDDANEDDGDGCASDCSVEDGYACADEPSVCSPGCGDGLVRGPEGCDDVASPAESQLSDRAPPPERPPLHRLGTATGLQRALRCSARPNLAREGAPLPRLLASRDGRGRRQGHPTPTRTAAGDPAPRAPRGYGGPGVPGAEGDLRSIV